MIVPSAISYNKKPGGGQSLEWFHSFLMSPRNQDLVIPIFYHPQCMDFLSLGLFPHGHRMAARTPELTKPSSGQTAGTDLLDLLPRLPLGPLGQN